jgi:hypothetical protein
MFQPQAQTLFVPPFTELVVAEVVDAGFTGVEDIVLFAPLHPAITITDVSNMDTKATALFIFIDPCVRRCETTA